MFLGGKDVSGLALSVGNLNIKATDYVKLLGVYIDNQLKFDIHIESICKKANQKVRALFRIRKYLSENQTKSLCDAYVLSCFRYCPLIWMFSNKTLSGKITKVQKRCMHVIYSDSNLSGYELMKLYSVEPVHKMHLRFLLTEVYKSLHFLNPGFMQSYYVKKSLSFELRDPEKLVLPAAHTLKYGANTFLFRSIILWNSLPVTLKQSDSLASFKSALKASDIRCTCHLCL